jgi:hypothetical protein
VDCRDKKLVRLSYKGNDKLRLISRQEMDSLMSCMERTTQGALLLLQNILSSHGSYSGRLPYTIGKSITDYSAQVTVNQAGSITPISYTEGIFIDYRHFDQVSIMSGAHRVTVLELVRSIRQELLHDSSSASDCRTRPSHILGLPFPVQLLVEQDNLVRDRPWIPGRFPLLCRLLGLI